LWFVNGLRVVVGRVDIVVGGDSRRSGSVEITNYDDVAPVLCR